MCVLSIGAICMYVVVYARTLSPNLSLPSVLLSISLSVFSTSMILNWDDFDNDDDNSNGSDDYFTSAKNKCWWTMIYIYIINDIRERKKHTHTQQNQRQQQEEQRQQQQNQHWSLKNEKERESKLKWSRAHRTVHCAFIHFIFSPSSAHLVCWWFAIVRVRVSLFVFISIYLSCLLALLWSHDIIDVTVSVSLLLSFLSFFVSSSSKIYFFYPRAYHLCVCVAILPDLLLLFILL